MILTYDKFTSIRNPGRPIQVQSAVEDDKGRTISLTYVPTNRTINGHDLTKNIVLTKEDIGLGNVDNTSDDDKPVSKATLTYITNELKPIHLTLSSHGVAIDELKKTVENHTLTLTTTTTEIKEIKEELNNIKVEATLLDNVVSSNKDIISAIRKNGTLIQI